MLKKLVLALGLVTALSAPAFAQAYSQSYGTGNIINQSLAEQTNGADGIGVNAYSPAQPGFSAYAYAPKTTHTSRKTRSRMH